MASCPSPCLNGHVKLKKKKKQAVFLLNSYEVLPKMSGLSNLSFFRHRQYSRQRHNKTDLDGKLCRHFFFFFNNENN